MPPVLSGPHQLPPPTSDPLLRFLRARRPSEPVPARFQSVFAWTTAASSAGLFGQTLMRAVLAPQFGIEPGRAIVDMVGGLSLIAVLFTAVRRGDLRAAARWVAIVFLAIAAGQSAIGGLIGATVVVFAFVIALFVTSIFGTRRDLVLLAAALLAVAFIGFQLPYEAPSPSTGPITFVSFSVGIVLLATIMSAYRYTLEDVQRDLSASNAELRTAIAERDRLEAGLRESQRLEAMGRLAGGIAHDFNNLLAALRGYLHLASIAYATGDKRPPLDEMSRIVEQGAGLTRQLLAFARLQPGRVEAVDIGALVRNAEPMVRQLVGAGVDLRLQVPNAPAIVRGDPSQLSQVLLNLAVNASDAMPGGGTLTISVGKWAARDGHVLLTVRDTGAGIPDDIRGRIFEPFFTTKQSRGGTGLGLATCYGIVQQHLGTITVDSAAGRGSSFHVELPLSAVLPVLEVSPSADDSAVAFVRPREARGTALVVEDEPDLRTVVAQILREGGWDVTALSEGSEALAVIETRARLDRAPTLLVSDVIIPQTDGATIAHRFRDLFPDARIVLMSGYHEQPEVEALLARGNAAFVPKPFSPDDLVRAVQGASLAPTPTTVA